MNRPIKQLMILFAASLLPVFLPGCTDVEPVYSTLSITVKPPPDQAGIDLTAVKVRAQAVDEPIFYETFPDVSGHAVLNVSPGRYTLLLSALYPEGFSVSASQSEFLALSAETTIFSFTLDLALSGGIIFRQIYYAGSKTLDGANYSKDQFLELYNNTDQVYYLDSLCVGTLAPANSTVSNNPWMGLDTLGLFQMTWMIPGKGTDYPLAPGESVVLAFNAVDHTARATSGLDLSRAHFGFYDEELPNHEKHPDVPALKRIFAGQGTAYTMSVHSPAPVIFRPVMGVARWLADVERWQNYQPGSTSGLKYMHIHRSWILDGVECVQNPANALKRQPASVDAGFTWLRQGQNKGNAVVRKVKEVLPSGRIIYSDTNNSTGDFLYDVPAAPILTPLWK
ncbi:MAG TPA: DUF4876 domain-containing protein [Bacteroidales bacterium]|nr:MAG: hypothetical protein BWX93_01476 [Bacteroidetes bacterium ADurb.Bin139]HOG25636.1 DUF4876 domain-containing protein [Bacteroidales bacterium]HOR11729.1 DUF4876 domain-containing protein [Bacteroidales bacterium]HOZ19633.1 DUF4876 domain-containing protein [Bacteroidales bacterium]HPB77114.1 DUF4876 domain-containing protein [Bacteroidales bacterium]